MTDDIQDRYAALLFSSPVLQRMCSLIDEGTPEVEAMKVAIVALHDAIDTQKKAAFLTGLNVTPKPPPIALLDTRCDTCGTDTVLRYCLPDGSFLCESCRTKESAPSSHSSQHQQDQ